MARRALVTRRASGCLTASDARDLGLKPNSEILDEWFVIPRFPAGNPSKAELGSPRELQMLWVKLRLSSGFWLCLELDVKPIQWAGKRTSAQECP